mmetsp:Transcript_28336/g.25040  ORF Transcript_28336/g.25040 Transcript_28336/m.25040 type:complete len:114 (+) Transcript_28336:571-912(+)
MFNMMNTHGIKISHKNQMNVTGLNILKKRGHDGNPYDNISSVKKFYQYAVVNMPNFDKLKENYQDSIWENQENLDSTDETSRSIAKLRKESVRSKKKEKQLKRAVTQRERKAK